MTRARDISNVITDANLGGTLDVSGAFTSQGIDDNADATAITIDSSETVGIKNTAPGNYLDGELTVGDSTKDQYINVVTGTGNAAGICFQDTTGTSIISGLRYTHLDNALGIWTNGSQRTTIDSTGNMLFNQSGTGVYLGVTSATASNLLSDYEEGTWTPSFSDLSNTPTYHLLTGKYTKIGRQVMVQLSMQSNASPTFNDNNNVLAITGLPFAIDSVGYVSGVGAVSKQTLSYNGSNNNSNVTGEIVAIANTSEQINFQVSTSGGLRGNVKNVGATGGFIIELTLFYTGS